jgi:hypothetical protein
MAPTMPAVNLDTGAAAEFAEMLPFLHDWFASNSGRLDESLRDFVGGRAYDTDQLRGDLNRFAHPAPEWQTLPER